MMSLLEKLGIYGEIEAPERSNPTPLLFEAMALIETYPENHNQGIWFKVAYRGQKPLEGRNRDKSPACGTAGCLAGWGIVLHDKRLANRIQNGWVTLPNSTRVAVRALAAHLFGLRKDHAAVLFGGWWGTSALRAGVEALRADPHISRDALDVRMHFAEGNE